MTYQDDDQTDGLPLSAELAACEAALAGFGPAESQLDRGQLMYHAGWAAAEEQFRPVVEPRRSELGVWRISLMSAAAAAALAVVVTRQAMLPAQLADNVSSDPPAVVVADSSSDPPAVLVAAAAPEPRVSEAPRKARSARELLRGNARFAAFFEEPRGGAATDEIQLAAEVPLKSALQLRREMLSTEPPRPAIRLGWLSQWLQSDDTTS